MSYRYHYTAEQDVYLPTAKIHAKGNDKEAVYESEEPISHPDFTLIETAEQAQEEPQQQITPVEQPQEQPHQAQPQAENVSHEGDTQVQ